MPGSPNGKGVAFFLVQHKWQLGLRTVTRISIFYCGGPEGDGHDHSLGMIIHVGPVPRSRGEDPEEPDAKRPQTTQGGVRSALVGF